MLLSFLFFSGGGIQLCKNGQRSYRGNTEAVSDSSIVRDPNGVSLSISAQSQQIFAE